MKKIIIALIVAMTASTCLATEVNLNINYNVDGEEFNLNQEYTNSKGVKYKITAFQYYMFGFKLDDAFLGDYILADSEARSYKLGDLEIKSVDNLTISFGVSPFDNIGVDPNSFPPGHALSPQKQTMHWGWAAGYRFWLVDGFSDPDGDGEFDKSFQYHALGDEALRTILFEINTESVNGVLDLNIDFDVQKLLAPIDMTEFNIHHEFYNNSQEIRDFIDNITPSGAISSQSITSVEVVNNSLSISPNPAEDFLNVTDEYLNSSYDIISLDGNKVLSGYITNSQIKLEAIPSGTYIVRIYDDNEMISTAKFVKK